jgi:hypothetical protein
MKFTLVMQEGLGAGQSVALDPSIQPNLTVGRSASCNITLQDHRASRHHADIRWSGRYWQVVDQGSTNGTYVNGMRVHRPHDLGQGDRVTIGETTMVLRGESHQPAAPPMPAQPQHMPPRQSAGPAVQSEPSTGLKAAFWVVVALLGGAVVFLASGALLPWLRVEGSMSEDLGPLIQGATDIISSLMGPDSLFHLTQEIGGLEGYGKLTLGVALICALALAIDIFFFRQSAAPGLVYLLSGLIASGAMASDLYNFYTLYKQVESWSTLFGIELGEVVQFLDRFITMEVTPLVGLQLTVAGLVLLLVGGVARLVVGFLGRSRL